MGRSVVVGCGGRAPAARRVLIPITRPTPHELISGNARQPGLAALLPYLSFSSYSAVFRSVKLRIETHRTLGSRSQEYLADINLTRRVRALR